jgi:hypothetical protein
VASGNMQNNSDKEGRVVICTARDCMWNDAALCVADGGIMVNMHKDHADCNTYTKNQHIPGQTPGTARL